MSDKLKKFLTRLSAKDLARVRMALMLLQSGDLSRLDVKALTGKPGFIRVRVGRVRIICKRLDEGYEILHITNRNEKTYKGL